MDKREQKTLNAVYDAFEKLIEIKEYDKISVQDIVSYAHISRSTFYAHFEKIDDVLSSTCNNIFDHVFSLSLRKEAHHDFSSSNMFDYDHIITHIFYHFFEEKNLIKAILSSKGRAHSLFILILRERVLNLMNECLSSSYVKKKDIPFDIQVEQLRDSFVSLITYWVNNGFKESPETMTLYFSRLHS